MRRPAGRAPGHARAAARSSPATWLLCFALTASALAGATSARAAEPAAAPALPIATTVADSGLRAGAMVFPVRVSVRPDHVRLGEPLRLRAWVLVPHATRAQWLPPDSGGAVTWSAVAARRGAGPGPLDTLLLESRLQIFATGPVIVPGPRFRVPGLGDGAARRLPAVRVTVMASPGIADSSADLHALRAPLEAPWWERVPWTAVVLGILLLAALIAWWRWLRRRKRVAAPAQAAVRPARDPADVALEELEALRRLGLPAAGRFADHAFQLTRIARRFLEATAGTPRPGDSTPELVQHLEVARLDAAQIGRLALLLRAWDQVKFARQPSTVAESERAEQGVEELARRRLLELRPPAAAPGERVA